jgi:hypothetical protein
MTTAQILTYARFLTNTNTATAPDASLLSCITEWNKKLTAKLADLGEGYGETMTALDLASGSEAVSLPSDCMKVKRLEIKWTDSGTWRKVNIYDLNESEEANDTATIASDFSQDNPFADIMGNFIYLRPIPNADVSAGLNCYYYQIPSAISATSVTPTSPPEFHRYLVDLLGIDIRQMKGELSPAQAINEEEAIWHSVKEQGSFRIKNQDRYVRAKQINYE